MSLEDDLKFLKEAYAYASKYSTDPNTQTGAIIVKRNKIVAMGANHEPKGVILTGKRKERPLKYDFLEHAERNAIYEAARKGVKLKGAKIYSPWFPCAPCARAIIQSGIEEIICHAEMDELSTKGIVIDTDKAKIWDHSQYHALEMFEDAGVKYRSARGKIGGVKVLFREEIFEP